MTPPGKADVRATAGSATTQQANRPASAARSPQDEVLALQGQAGNQAVDGALRGRTTSSVPATATLTRVELYLAETQLLAVLDGAPPLAFVLTALPQVPPAASSLRWGYENGLHRLNVGAQADVLVPFRGLQTDLDAFSRLAKAAPNGVPARVYASAGAPPIGAGESEEGERAEPLVGDESVLATDPALAGLYLDFVIRYASAKVDRSQAARGLDAEQVRKIIKDSPKAGTVTKYFTQAWKEYRGTGGQDVGVFGILAETVLTQWERGNYTALHNLLEVGTSPEGLGLYKRRTPLRYYDENGTPVTGPGGSIRDSGYRAAAPPSFALHIPTPNPGQLKVLAAIHQVTVDSNLEIYLAAKGYAENGDLLWPRVRDRWDKWPDIVGAVRDQMGALVFFLAGDVLAKFLQKSADIKAKAVGVALEEILKITGKVFNVWFASDMALLVQHCGLELSLIRRQEGAPLDALSERHLDAAAKLMRQLLTAAIATGLVVAWLKASAKIAGSLPPGPGGGLAPAPATAGAGRGRVPGTGAGAAAAQGPGSSGRLGPLLPPDLRQQAVEPQASGEPEQAGGRAEEPRAAGEKEPGTGEKERRPERPADPRPAVVDRARKNLAELQKEREATDVTMEELNEELSNARAKETRLRREVGSLPAGSKERTRALEELHEAQEALAELKEKDALTGEGEERVKQDKREAAIISSLNLQRPALSAQSKLKIRAKAATTPDGRKFLDANTKEVIEGEPVYGHKYGKEHRRLALEAALKGMSQEQFSRWVNDNAEDFFQLETKANNESHKYEKKGID